MFVLHELSSVLDGRSGEVYQVNRSLHSIYISGFLKWWSESTVFLGIYRLIRTLDIKRDEWGRTFQVAHHIVSLNECRTCQCMRIIRRCRELWWFWPTGRSYRVHGRRVLCGRSKSHLWITTRWKDMNGIPPSTQTYTHNSTYPNCSRTLESPQAARGLWNNATPHERCTRFLDGKTQPNPNRSAAATKSMRNCIVGWGDNFIPCDVHDLSLHYEASHPDALFLSSDNSPGPGGRPE